MGNPQGPSAFGPGPSWNDRNNAERDYSAAQWRNGPVTKGQIIGIVVTLAALFLAWKFLI